LIVNAAGHSNLAIVVEVAATVALFAALELDGETAAEDEHGLTVERLALVLVYAWQQSNVLGDSDPTFFAYVRLCRQRAIGIG
jgi:hypothetical protein